MLALHPYLLISFLLLLGHSRIVEGLFFRGSFGVLFKVGSKAELDLKKTTPPYAAILDKETEDRAQDIKNIDYYKKVIPNCGDTIENIDKYIKLDELVYLNQLACLSRMDTRRAATLTSIQKLKAVIADLMLLISKNCPNDKASIDEKGAKLDKYFADSIKIFSGCPSA